MPEDESFNVIEQKLFLVFGPSWRRHGDERLAEMSEYPVEVIRLVRAGDAGRLRQYRMEKDRQRGAAWHGKT